MPWILVTRAAKGRELTWEEMDGNLVYLRDLVVAAAPSAAAAAASATAAAGSASAAATSAANASVSAVTASNAATTATTQAGIATTGATTATTQAGIATTGATTATTQAGIATTQAGIATTQAGNATTQAASAATSRAAIDNRIYPTASASDPTLRPDGSAVQSGDMYFNSSSQLWKRYNGSTWVASDINTANLAATTGAGLVGHKSSATGATATTLRDKALSLQTVDQDFGAVGDGTTNDTAKIQASLDALGYAILTGGKTYLVTGITMPAGSRMFSRNGRATLKLSGGGGTVITIAVANVTVSDVDLDGGSIQTYQGGGTSAGTGYGITVAGSAGVVSNINLQNIDARYFNNTALNFGEMAATSVYGKSVNCTNVRAHLSRTGWYLGPYAEYMLLASCHGTLCHYGIRQAGGNNKVVLSNFESNYFNCYLETGANPLHGGFYGCSFNHATGGSSGRSLYADTVTLGHEFIGCKFWYGNIELVSCSGIRICNGQIASSGSTFTVNGGGVNWVHDNMVYGTYTKSNTNSRLRWMRNEAVGDNAATAKDNFLPQYFARASLTSVANLVSAAAPGTFCSITGVEGFLHGVSDTTNTVGSGFFKFPEAGLFQISGRFNVKPHTGAGDQKATVTLRVVNAEVVEQSKFVVERTLPAASTGDDLIFSDTFFAQAGWFLGIYVNSSLATVGLDTVSADIVVQSKN